MKSLVLFAIFMASVLITEASPQYHRVFLTNQQLKEENKVQESYNNQTKISCSSIASSRAPVFCISTGGECLLADVEAAPYYDGPRNVTSKCYTNKTAVVSYETYASECSAGPPCCLPPFEEVPDVGCLYINTSQKLNFEDSRAKCRSLWPTADLLHKPAHWGSLKSYMNDKHVHQAHVGAYENSLNYWVWVDGSPVQGGNWGHVFFEFFGSQPDGYCIGDSILSWNSADCAAVSTDSIKYPAFKLLDHCCSYGEHSICQMK